MGKQNKNRLRLTTEGDQVIVDAHIHFRRRMVWAAITSAVIISLALLMPQNVQGFVDALNLLIHLLNK